MPDLADGPLLLVEVDPLVAAGAGRGSWAPHRHPVHLVRVTCRRVGKTDNGETQLPDNGCRCCRFGCCQRNCGSKMIVDHHIINFPLCDSFEQKNLSEKDAKIFSPVVPNDSFPMVGV